MNLIPGSLVAMGLLIGAGCGGRAEAGPISTHDAGTPEAGGTAGSGGADGGGAEAASAGASGASEYGVEAQSCAGMVGNECEGEDCCTGILVPGGTFPMGRSEDGDDACPAGVDCMDHEQPEHPATVSAFYLDKFEVTVGRFRAFVEQFDGTPPPNGAGAHALIPGSGWQNDWDLSLASSHEMLLDNLKCGAYWLTWTDTAGQNETYPITCVTWFEAFAFCAWDGGRLPTDAEWEFAAAGGSENRLYPWGSDDPSVNTGLANASYNLSNPHVSVGSCPLGAARWGHQDLAGSMGEWVLDWRELDWYSSGGATCDNCANLTPGSRRSLRGGAWSVDKLSLRAAFVGGLAPDDRSYYRGFRCARTP